MSEVTLSPIIIDAATEQAPQEQQSAFRKWAGLAVLSLGLAIVIIDTTLLNVSLATIIKDLHTDLKSIQWVITAYALMLAAFTITGGRIGDLFGRKRIFMLGAIIFAVGSFIASVAHSLPILLWGESIIEGVGAALMMPATSSLVVANFKGKDRATAFGIWGGVAGASSAIGPLLGGYLTSHFSWRWGFRINIFVVALVIIGAVLYLKESRDEEDKPTLDWGGVVLSALGLLSLVFGVIESSQYGWWKAKEAFVLFHHTISFGSISIVPVAIAIGLALITAFIWWEKKVEEKGQTPLMSLSLLKNTQFTSGMLTVSIMTLGMTGLIFALPIFLQSVNNLDAFHTGLAMLPLSLALLVAAPISASLSKKFSPKYIIQIGLALAVVSMFIIRAVLKVDMPISHLIPGLVVYGFGLGMVFAPISNLTLSAVPVKQAGEASGVNNTLRQVGASLGAAIIGAAVLTSLISYLSVGIQNSQIIPESAKSQIIQNVANPNSNIEFGQGDSSTNNAPQAVKDEINSLVKQASTNAAKDAYIYGALFIFLGFLVSLFLPTTSVHDEEHSEKDFNHSNAKIITTLILGVLAIVATVLFLNHTSKAIITTGKVDVEAIRNNFPLPVNQQKPAVLGIQTPTATPSSVNNEPIFPRGPEVATTAPASKPVATLSTYKNTSLGFQMQISSLWQATESSDGHTIIFQNVQGQNISVQSYDAAGEDLNTVQTQLSGSPSVRGIAQTTFHGEPALSFQTTSGVQGITIIHGGKLFYIIGPNLNQEPVTTLFFI
jgi:EmrB/QacA subfamily drug resistance transporter